MKSKPVTVYNSREIKECTIKLSRIDLSIIIFSIISMLTALYLAFNEAVLFKAIKRENELTLKSFAKVTHTTNKVQRKYAQDFNWYRLSAPDAVFESDSIFTEENANAEITFKDGSKLFIDSATMLTLKSQGEEKSLINIEKGSVSGTLSKGRTLKVQTKGQSEKSAQEISGDNSKLQLKVNEAGKTELAVLEGKIEISKGDGPDKKKEVIQENQMVKIDTKGKLENISEIAIRLTSPTHQKVIWATTKEIAIDFSWQVSNAKPLDRYKIELATDSRFQKIIQSNTTTGSEKTIRLSSITTRGTHYWHIIGYKGEQEVKALTYSFTLLEELPLLLLSPDANSVFNPIFENVTEALAINLRWQDNSPSPLYVVEMGLDPQIEKRFISTKVSDTSYRTPGLKSGDYYWRVRAMSKDRPYSTWSEIRHFKIDGKIKGTKSELLGFLKKAPLTAPDNASSTSILDRDSKEGIETITLKWMKVPKAFNYLLKIGASKEKLEEIIVNNNFYVVKEKAPGTYIWIVAAMDENKNIGDWSNAKTFTIKPPPAKLERPEIEFDQEKDYFADEAITISWSQIEKAKGYRYQISTGTSFDELTNLLDKKTDETKATFTPRKGQTPLYFRVQAINPPYKSGDFSKILEIILEKEINPPVIFLKENPIRNTDQATLYFKKVDGGQDYLIQFSKNKNFNSIQEEEETDNTTVAIPFKEEGVYYARAKCTAKNGRVSRFSDTLTINIILPLPAPGIVYAKDLNPPYFVWDKSPKTSISQIQIASVGHGEIINKTINNNFFKLENFAIGQYEWRVRYIAPDGYPGKYSEVNKFTINNPNLISICQNKIDLVKIKEFDLDKISVDTETGCLIIEKTK